MPALAPAAQPQTRVDLDELQGAWISVAGPREARLLIAGNRFTFEFVGGDIYMGTFDLAPTADGHAHRGRAGRTRQGKSAQCLYRVEGGVLRWCPGRPGSGRRPSSFPCVDDPRYLSFVFRQTRRPAPPFVSRSRHCARVGSSRARLDLRPVRPLSVERKGTS